MDTWFSVDLGDGVAAYGPSLKIQEAFTSFFIAADCPQDMAVFSRYNLKQNVVTVYFTPSASSIAKLFKATPCEKPSRPELGLLVGDVRVWAIFYPAQNKGRA